MKSSPEVIWSKKASQGLLSAYDHIKEDSVTNALKVRAAIVAIVDALPDNPEKFPPDKFKINNPGNYRAFEKYSYRVTDKHTTSVIRILRFRHVKQEPLEY